MLLPASPDDLPVRPVLPDVVAALRSRGTAVLVAPPGSGKTSLLPLALADALPGRIVVAEPRRLATRAAARRLASLVGEPLGASVGFAMRGERVAGTRIEVVTTGLLVQRLQRDPELPGVGAIVLDECHERQLDADLALAFAVDVRATLREDLCVVATSATPDTVRMRSALGDGEDAPLVVATSGTYPVDVVWAPPPSREWPAFWDHVVSVVRRALAEQTGDVLVFVPGEAEVDRVSRRLSGVDVFPLYGRQSAADQERALTPGPSRRVVVTTAVAESSLTVPGVRIVVDAGQSRQPRMDHARGLGALVTVRVSRASAEQRAGRAGREGPGVVYRCWSPVDHDRLEAHAPPEIATSDLAPFALSVAAWGAPGGSGLALLDAPPAAALDTAVTLLRELGAVDDAGRITPRGRALASIGTHPRLARALLDGAAAVGATRAREIVALLSDDSVVTGDDLVAVWRSLRRGDGPASSRWKAEVRRLPKVDGGGGRSGAAGAASDGARVAGGAAGAGAAGAAGARRPLELNDDLAVGIVVGLAYPDRLARARAADATSYLTAGGVGASLAPGSGLRGTPWLAIAAADRPAGRADARIRAAAPIDEATARSVAGGFLRTETEVTSRNGRAAAREVERLGAIELSSRPVRATREQAAAAAREGLRASGLDVLRWNDAARELRARLDFLHRTLGDPWPDVSDQALLARAEDWLELPADLTRDVTPALRRLLPWPEAAQLDTLAPERLPIPAGGTRRVDYSADQPFLSLKVQEAFGWSDGPRVAGGRVPVVLHFLSPAGRPTAVTSDLASFWTQGYPQVRADLRGRYPRHPWPEDPTTATPTSRTKPKSR